MTLPTSQIVLLLWAVTMIAVPLSASGPPNLNLIKFFVNQTFLQNQFPCSQRELECFKKLKLLYKEDGKCYTVGEQGPCAEGEIFHADKQEASRLGGHFRGNCSSGCGDVSKYPVGATGECLTRAEVEEQICREDLYLRPALNAFGQWVCEWTELPCQAIEKSAPVTGEYEGMEYNGLCYAPYFLRSWLSDDRNITKCNNETSNHPALKYFTNTTYRELEYPCTEEEKACLQYGRLLHTDGNCYIPGVWSNACNGSIYHVDWEEVKNGCLRGTCNSTCTDDRQPNVYNGECETYSDMMETCRWEWGMQYQQNEFGQMACQCYWTPGSATASHPPSLPPPASGPGLCRFPDFSNPVKPPAYDMTLTVGFRVSCTEEEFACLREGRVLVRGACHVLRTQGPCEEGEEVVLNKEALENARLEGVCKARPCAEGSVLVPIDGQCLTHKQVASRLCEGQSVSLDEFGEWHCGGGSGFQVNLRKVFRDGNGTCELPENTYAYPDNPTDAQDSSENDTGVMTNSTTGPGGSVDNNTV